MQGESNQEHKVATQDNLVRNVRLGLAIPFAILFVVFLIAGLYSFVDPTEPSEKKDFVQSVGVLIAGIAGVVGLFFTWRNLRLTRENTEKQLQVAREGQERTQATAQETLRLAEQGQITERFTRAIDQLGGTDDKGNKRLEIRLGGIYALERIARDSERDHEPIIEVLTSYVRKHAPWPPEHSSNQQNRQPSQGLAQRLPDIQAILTVIGRRRHHYRSGEEKRIDLNGTDLRGAELRDAHLEGANLTGAHLEGADLSGTHLEWANLSEAHLEGTVMWGGRSAVEDASLSEAHLQEAVLYGAYLEGAVLSSDLRRAYLSDAHLVGTYLNGAYAEQADLYNAYLEGADLAEARMQGANLSEAHLQGADLSNTDLQGADLHGAHLEGANIRGANLSSPKWSSSLTQEQVQRAIGDDNTQLPCTLQRPLWWRQGIPELFLPAREYSTEVFEPALSFSVTKENVWFYRAHLHRHLPDSLMIGCNLNRNRGDDEVRRQLSFLNVREVFDPQNPTLGFTLPMPDDLVAWFQAHPHLDTNKPTPTTLGRISGIQFDATVSSSPNSFPPDFSHPCVILFALRYGYKSYQRWYPFSHGYKYRATALRPWFAFYKGYKYRVIVLKLRDQTVTVVIESPAYAFDAFLLEAGQLLTTIEWNGVEQSSQADKI